MGQHLLTKLINERFMNIYAITRKSKSYKFGNLVSEINGDLRDAEFVLNAIEKISPDYVIHLAAESSVAFSWQHPNTSFQNNVNIYLNLLEALRKTKSKARVLSVGSSEEYGIVDSSNIPISESVCPNPISPYAVARLAQSKLSKVYSNGYDLDIISTRSFNHFGENQTNRFVIPSFIEKVNMQKKTRSKEPILVGDLSIIRDFLHVHDALDAYIELLRSGKPGTVYNVCSGEGLSLQQLLQMIYAASGIEPNYIISNELIRPSDNPIIIGDNSKILKSTNWRPKKIVELEIKKIIKLKENNYGSEGFIR